MSAQPANNSVDHVFTFITFGRRSAIAPMAFVMQNYWVLVLYDYILSSNIGWFRLCLSYLYFGQYFITPERESRLKTRIGPIS